VGRAGGACYGGYPAAGAFHSQLAKSSAAWDIPALAPSPPHPAGSRLGGAAVTQLRAFKAKMLFELLQVRLQKSLTVPV